MSVVVLGMEMPKDCDSCWVPGQVCNLWLKTDVGKRNRECPIRLLPDAHGDLIDRDALPSRVEWEDVVNAPVVVEAEGD